MKIYFAANAVLVYLRNIPKGLDVDDMRQQYYQPDCISAKINSHYQRQIIQKFEYESEY